VVCDNKSGFSLDTSLFVCVKEGEGTKCMKPSTNVVDWLVGWILLNSKMVFSCAAMGLVGYNREVETG
jgi:hypothetical protein